MIQHNYFWFYLLPKLPSHTFLLHLCVPTIPSAPLVLSFLFRFISDTWYIQIHCPSDIHRCFFLYPWPGGLHFLFFFLNQGFLSWAGWITTWPPYITYLVRNFHINVWTLPYYCKASIFSWMCPLETKIHIVFHVSQLKTFNGHKYFGHFQIIANEYSF